MTLMFPAERDRVVFPHLITRFVNVFTFFDQNLSKLLFLVFLPGDLLGYK
jgi:hypothetical protein